MSELIDKEDYESWLREQDYAETTVQESVMSADGILQKTVIDGQLPPVTMWFRARRLVKYAQARAFPWAENDVLLAAAGKDAERASERQTRKRKLEAKSFDDAGWQRLAQAIFANTSKEARVLEIVMLSGLRISDALRIRMDSIREALETRRLETIQKGRKPRVLMLTGEDDPLQQALTRLLVAYAEHGKGDGELYKWIVPSSSARLPIDSARKACYNKLRAIGQQVALRGRIHLHRMRRTVAVQALRSGADVMAVGELMGHERGSHATMRYIDEARLDDVAAARRRINEKFIKKEGT